MSSLEGTIINGQNTHISQGSTITGQSRRRYITPQLLQQLTNHNDSRNVTSLDLSPKFVNEKFSTLENLDVFVNLISLHLSHNEFTDLRGLSKLSRLQVLVADHNKISSLNGIGELKQLKTLVLSHNRIERLPKKNIVSWDSLKKLETLDLSHNQLDCMADIQRLSQCPQLERFNIEGNPICNFQITQLYTIFWLPALQLLDNKLEITDEVRDEARLRFSQVYSINKDIEDRDSIIEQLTTKLDTVNNELETEQLKSKQIQKHVDDLSSELKKCRQDLDTKSHLLEVAANSRSQLLEELNNTKMELENIKMGLEIEHTGVKQRTETLREELFRLERNKLLYEQKLGDYKEEIDRIVASSATGIPKTINEFPIDNYRRGDNRVMKGENDALHQVEQNHQHDPILALAMEEVQGLAEQKHHLELELANVRKQVEQFEVEKNRLESEAHQENQRITSQIQSDLAQLEKIRNELQQAANYLDQKNIEKLELEKALLDLKKNGDMERDTQDKLLNDLRTEFQELNARKESVEQSVQLLESKLKQSKTDLTDLNDKKDLLTRYVSDLELQLNTKKNHLNETVIEKQSELEKLNNELYKIRFEVEQADLALSKKKYEIEHDIERKIRDLEMIEQQKQQELARISEQTEQKRLNISQQEMEYQILTRKIEESQKKLRDMNDLFVRESEDKSVLSWKRQLITDIETNFLSSSHHSDTTYSVMYTRFDSESNTPELVVCTRKKFEDMNRNLQQLEQQVKTSDQVTLQHENQMENMKRRTIEMESVLHQREQQYHEKIQLMQQDVSIQRRQNEQLLATVTLKDQHIFELENQIQEMKKESQEAAIRTASKTADTELNQWQERIKQDVQAIYTNEIRTLSDQLESEKKLYKQNMSQLQSMFTQKEMDLIEQIHQLKQTNSKMQKELEFAISMAQHQQLSNNSGSRSNEFTNHSSLSNASSEFYDQLKLEISHLSQQRSENFTTTQLKSQIKEQRAQLEFLISQNEHLKKEIKRHEGLAHNHELFQQLYNNVEWIVSYLKRGGNVQSTEDTLHRSISTFISNSKAVTSIEVQTESSQSSSSNFFDSNNLSTSSGSTNTSSKRSTSRIFNGDRLILSFVDSSTTAAATDQSEMVMRNKVIEITQDLTMNERIRMLLNWVSSTKNILKHTHILMEDLNQQSDCMDMLDENKKQKLRKLLSKFSPSKHRHRNSFTKDSPLNQQ